MNIIFLILGLAQSQLLFVAEISRHGAREPEKDLSWYKSKNEDKKSLTPEGLRQHCAIGYELKTRYPTLITDQYNPQTMTARSSDHQRTLSSAIAQLSCMFPQQSNFSITTDSRSSDNMLKPKKACSGIRDMVKSAKDRFEELDLLPQYMQYEITEIEKEENPYKSFRLVNDAISSLVFQGEEEIIPYSKQFIKESPEYWKKYKQILYQSDIRFLQLFVSEFFSELHNTFTSILQEECHKKFALYSAHDYNIAIILALFDSWESEPPFASVILFELWKFDGVAMVKVLYNDKIIHLCKSHAIWTFIEFENFLKSNHLTDETRYTCENLKWVEPTTSTLTIIVVALPILFILIFIIAQIVKFLRKSNLKDEYKYKKVIEYEDKYFTQNDK